MSRSLRKSKVAGVAICASEKVDKARWHRAFRRAANADVEQSQFISFREFSDPWCMGKDGKGYWAEMPPHLMRK